MPNASVSLDALASDIVARSGWRFEVASDEHARDAGYRLRCMAVIEQGWMPASEFPDGRERDRFDERAVHIVGWDGPTPIATGRLVPPPGPVPTEEACGIAVEPAGRVVDVGRMTVARSHRGAGHSAFIALLASLYLEVRRREFEFACGLMSVRARSALRLLGLQVDVLGGDLQHWGEARAPVRFAVLIDRPTLESRWR